MLKQLNDDKLKQLNDDKSSLASHREAILMANKRYCAAAWDLSKQRDKDRENSDRRGFEGVCGGAAIDAVVSTFDTSILNDWDNLTINNRKHAVEVVQWWGLFMPDSSCGLVDRVCEHAIRGCKPPPEEEELLDSRFNDAAKDEDRLVDIRKEKKKRKHEELVAQHKREHPEEEYDSYDEYYFTDYDEWEEAGFGKWNITFS